MTLHRCSKQNKKQGLYENVSFKNTGFTSLYNKLVYLRRFSVVNKRHFKQEQICSELLLKQASKQTNTATAEKREREISNVAAFAPLDNVKITGSTFVDCLDIKRPKKCKA